MPELDARTLACINLYAVLGALENLCEIDGEARRLASVRKPISVGFDVKDGPSATLTFQEGKCTLREGCRDCTIRLPFSSCEKFNGLIDGTVTPVPSRGFLHIGFLLGRFTKLTDLLTRYLKAPAEELTDPEFKEKSTTLMFYVIVAALSQIGNEDFIGRFSASHIVDGIVQLSVKGGPCAGIRVKDGHMETVKRRPKKPRAVMEFESMELARRLFDGDVNSVACIGTGEIRMGGMISMVDNINRILDRVSVYLA
ncbi:MAG: hypothetical protein HFI38_02690 [Lachnospiraceae bacterium]|jgi:hypothetical protein|nr:hypothetical protein [Lachnospiraceae bacterium]